MTALYSAPVLSSGGTSAAVGVTDQYVASGIATANYFPNPPVFTNAMLPIFGGPVNAAVPGVYLTGSPGAVFSFRLSVHKTWPAPFGTTAILMSGDANSIMILNRPIAQVTGVDQITVEMSTCASGTLILSIIQ